MNAAALSALRELSRGPQPAGVVGQVCWPERIGRISSVNGGGDYAAQMLLGRLRKRGLVRTQHTDGSSIWEITKDGLRALDAADAALEAVGK